MMRSRFLAALVLFSAVSVAAAQPVTPPHPSTVLPEPAWSRTIRLADGRVFVTDGGFALDVVVAKPKTMPRDIQGEQSSKALTGHLAMLNPTDVGLSELKPGAKTNTFVAPNGITLNGNYVSFLRRSAPGARLRMKGPTDPIVVMLDGTTVGVFMPLKQ
jgi:hypothetical protein